MSQALRCRPSTLYGVSDPVAAYCFDSAVVRWGLGFEAAVQDATSKANSQQASEQAQRRVVRRWLKQEPGAGRPPGKVIQG